MNKKKRKSKNVILILIEQNRREKNFFRIKMKLIAHGCNSFLLFDVYDAIVCEVEIKKIEKY